MTQGHSLVRGRMVEDRRVPELLSQIQPRDTRTMRERLQRQPRQLDLLEFLGDGQ